MGTTSLKVAPAVLTATTATLFGAAVVVLASDGPDPSVNIVPVAVAALAAVQPTPLDDTNYWSVAGTKRPLAANVTSYLSADKTFEAGVSSYEQVTLELRDWPVDEFMYIVEGRVEITPAGGEPRVYGAGDAFVMPKGFQGTWRQLSDLRKIQVMYSGPPK